MAADKEKATAAKAKGNAAFAEKRYEEAIKHFTEAITHDPTDHVFFSNRSACNASLGRYNEALADGTECVRLKPDWPKGYTRKGLAEFFLEKYDEAAETYQAGLKLAPEDASLKEGLRKAMDAKYDVPGARPVKRSGGGGGAGGLGGLFGQFDPVGLAAAAAKNPKIKEYMQDPELLKKVQAVAAMVRGSNGGDSEVQQRLLIDAIQKDPRVIEVLAAAQGMEVRFADDAPPEEPQAKRPRTEPPASGASPSRAAPADQDAAASAKEDQPAPKDERTPEQKEADEFKAKGNELYKKRQFAEALAMYDKAIEKEPNDLTYYNNKSAVWVEMGEENYPKVLELCEDLIRRRYEINSANPGGASFEKVAKVYNRMASVYEKMNKFTEAIDMYGKSLTEDNSKQTRTSLRELERKKEKWEKDSYVNPELAEEHRQKGNEHFKANAFAEAKAEYDEAVRRNPRDAKLYSNRAAALTKLMAYPDALRDLEECLKLDPSFVKAYSRKGACHFFMKEYHKALEAYDKGLALEKDNEECRKGREQVYAKIMQTQRSDEVDEEQIRHAMADPDIQRILRDPQINLLIKDLQENPAEANKAMRSDPKLREAVSKLMAAGILRTR